MKQPPILVDEQRKPTTHDPQQLGRAPLSEHDLCCSSAEYLKVFNYTQRKVKTRAEMANLDLCYSLMEDR